MLLERRFLKSANCRSSSSSSGNKNNNINNLKVGVSPTRMLLLLALAGLLVAVSKVDCQEQLTVESRQQKDNDDLNDAIKYLEKLDKYFSQMARPRFGRSELKQPQLQQHRFPAATFEGGLIASERTRPMTTAATTLSDSPYVAGPTRFGNALDLVAARLAQRYRMNY